MADQSLGSRSQLDGGGCRHSGWCADPVRPGILNYVVAAYLILVGVLGLRLIRLAMSQQPTQKRDTTATDLEIQLSPPRPSRRTE
jgi:hypothetical protein